MNADSPIAVVRAIVEWANTETSVRAALLVGSRAAPDADIDFLSDYDIVLFLSDLSPCEESDEWLSVFGPILVMLHERYELLGHAVPTRLVQYEDGLRIDFSLCAPAILDRIVKEPVLPEMLDAGYRILIDKDDRLSRLPAATGKAYVPRRPTEAEYLRVVNEFWWESIYVAKHLARGELLPARYSGECVLRFECLVPMLAWYAESALGWNEPLAANGRGLAHLLGVEDRRRLNRTYAGAQTDENWAALFEMADFFMHMARTVGGQLGFEDTTGAGLEVTAHLRAIRARHDGSAR
jgi:aminoglycoside 6-adenylyltransferase